MASITVRDLDQAVKKRIKTLAVTHGRSMEAEARDILTRAASVQRPAKNLARSIRERLAKHGLDGIEFDIPPRSENREPPSFE